MKKVSINSAFIAEVIPIILILLFILYTKSTVELSYTVLGKLLAIFLIVGYTIYDVLYGLVMCMMIILYYQLDYVENMQNINESMDNMLMDNMTMDNMTMDNSNQTLFGKPTGNQTMFGKPGDILGDDILSHGVDITDMNVEEGMTTYYDFQKNHCHNNQLHYKDFPIRNDAVEHVFPEIKFNSGVCNPCDPNCQISFVNNKIDTETQLVLPKSSNDSIFDSWKDIFGKDNNFFPRLEDIGQNFALFK